MKRKFWSYTIRGNDYGSSTYRFKCGGIKEVIKHGETGYIVDVGDSEQASDYALKLLTDEQLYQRLQSNMLKDIKQRFSSELIVDQYEYYYKNVELKRGLIWVMNYLKKLCQFLIK